MSSYGLSGPTKLVKVKITNLPRFKVLLDCFASFDFESTVSQLACYWLCILPYPGSLPRGSVGKQEELVLQLSFASRDSNIGTFPSGNSYKFTLVSSI